MSKLAEEMNAITCIHMTKPLSEKQKSLYGKIVSQIIEAAQSGKFDTTFIYDTFQERSSQICYSKDISSIVAHLINKDGFKVTVEVSGFLDYRTYTFKICWCSV